MPGWKGSSTAARLSDRLGAQASAVVFVRRL